MGTSSLHTARRYLDRAADASDPGEQLYNIRQARQLMIATEELLGENE